METTLTDAPPVVEKQLNPFEHYLTVWVALCMVAGVVLGQVAPGLVHTLRTMEFGQGSHINLPIAVLIWLMIVPMMMKVDFASIRHVGARPTGLVITLFVNWVVKPFSMACFAWSSSASCLPRGSHRPKPISTSQGRSSWPQPPAPRWCLSGAI